MMRSTAVFCAMVGVMGVAGPGVGVSDAKGKPTAAAMPMAIRRVVIQHQQGTLHILGKIGSHTVTVDGGASAAGITVKAEGDAIEVRQAADGPAATLTVPPGVDLHITSTAGDIFVSGIKGSLELVQKSGNAVVGGRLSRLDAALESGSISATGLLGDCRLSLTAGNGQLWYDQRAPQGIVQLDVVRGNVTIAVPSGTADVRVTLPHGRVQAESGHLDPTARFTVVGNIEAGNLYLRQAR